MTAPGQDPVVQALQRVLAAQHAAIYGYPVIGVALRQSGQVQLARQLEAQHRHTRDELITQLAVLRAVPVPTEPSYSPPRPLTGPADAQRWAVELEQSCADAYRYLLVAPVLAAQATKATGKPSSATGPAAIGPAEQSALRRQALAGLSSAAGTGTEWRALLSPATPTVPFPGLEP